QRAWHGPGGGPAARKPVPPHVGRRRGDGGPDHAMADMTAGPLLCPIADRSQVGEARRRVADLAGRSGLDDVPRDRLALIVNELGSNLIKHGGGGDLIARALAEGRAVELLALDKGVGMPSVDRCFEDGYSTAGSAGTGLGAGRPPASPRGP